MKIEEITLERLTPEEFIKEKTDEIYSTVGNGLAINALSGGVDSATVTMLGHNALGDKQLKTYVVDNGLMREGEPEHVVSLFRDLGINVELVDAKETFFNALEGLKDPEEKREKGITQPFYGDVFRRLVEESGARYLFQGTGYTDIEETVAGLKRQHNVLEQLGIDTEKEFGYKVIEPLIQLRKPAIREVAKYLGLPEEIYNRMPFPGPALAARIIGEVTPERVETIRKATKIVEDELSHTGAAQYLAILHEDRVTGAGKDGERDFGLQIELRCWDSEDLKTATPTRLSYDVLDMLSKRIIYEVPGVVSVTYGITPKPPSTIEAI